MAQDTPRSGSQHSFICPRETEGRAKGQRQEEIEEEGKAKGARERRKGLL